MTKEDYKRKLRHIQPEGAMFFLTWHLHEAIPKREYAKIIANRNEAINKLRETNPPDINKQIYNQYKAAFIHFETILDRNTGNKTPLNTYAAAKVLIEVLRKHDGVLYSLEAFTIMSNHVHAVFDLSIQHSDSNQSPYVQLDEVMRRVKGESSRRINEVFGRRGTLWASETWDRYIRNSRHHYAVLNYIAENPVKAGMCKQWNQYAYTWIRGVSEW